MPRTTLTLSDGRTVTINHEEGIDEEDLRIYAEQQAPAATQRPKIGDANAYFKDQEEKPSVVTDLKRVLLDTQRDAVSLIDYLPGDAFGTDDMTDLAKQTRLSEIAGFGYMDTSEDIDPVTGKIKKPQTAIGIGASIVPYIAGAGALVKAVPKLAVKFAPKLAAKSVPKTVQYTLAGAASSQVLTDLDTNLFNVITAIFPEGTENTVFEALSSDDNDSQASKRLKLLIGDLGAGVVAESLFRAVPAFKNIITAKKPTADDLADGILNNAKELTKASSRRQEAIDKADDVISPFRADVPTAKETFKETGEGVAQVAAQKSENLTGKNWAKAKIKQVGQQIFTSRGYATPKMFKFFNQSQAQQASLIRESQQISRRLNNAFEEFSDEAAKKLNIEKSQELLTADLSKYTSLPLEKQAASLAKAEGISVKVAESLLDARFLIDRLAKQIAGSKGFSKEVTASIQKNMGTYLRTSYKAFDDPTNFKIDDALKNTVIQDFKDAKIAKALEQGKKITDKEALKAATLDINKLLEGVGKETIDYVTQVRRVAKFHKKKDIPENLKKLLGEIQDPAENIILSVSKAARIYETNNFYNILNELGKSGKYIQGAKTSAVADSRLTTKITNTNSILDGKYTTPEIAEVITRQEEVFKFMSSENGATEIYKSFLKFKGGAQASKTIYSHVTQLRNMLGGMQFAVANGDLAALNPLSKNRGHMKVLWNEIKGKGNKELDTIYNKYVDLGVINTSISVNQFRELISISSKDFGTKSITKIMDTNPVLKFMENTYTATDDYFKMSGFQTELQTLKKARPGVAVDILEREAADIIQNTIPNYSRVPKGLKKLNYLPIGNFISFPAEIIRTSTHIVKQASREINSGNTVLRNRGLKRIAGFTGAMVGVNQASKLSANLLGWTEEERQHHTKLAEGKFDENSEFLWFREANGNIGKISTKYLDSYNTIKEPVLKALDRIVTGELQGKQLDDYLFVAAADAALVVANPFITESIATKAVTDVLYAMRSRDGKTAEGKTLLPPSMSAGDKAAEILYQLYTAVEPGSVTSIRKLGNYVDAYTGEELEKLGPVNKYAFITNVTGANLKQHDPESQLKFEVYGYSKNKRSNIAPTIKIGKDTTASVFDSYIARQSKEYEYQQKLFSKVQAYSSLYGRYKTLETLKEAGLSGIAAEYIYNGEFKPTKPPSVENRVLEVLKTELSEDSSEYIEAWKASQEFNSVFDALDGISLYGDNAENPLEIDFDELSRLRRATGGEVSQPVPNAPSEPDERINKLTGLPYNEEAGPAYMDESDPMRVLNMAAGGRVKKNLGSLIRAGSKALGKSASKTADEIIEESDVFLTMPSDMSYLSNAASQTTQRANTVGTATKASNYLDDLGASGKSLDYGAGKGLNAQANKIDDTFEPFPEEGFSPTFTSPSAVPTNEYGKVISTNVINVLPPKLREEAVIRIGNSLKAGGKALIQTWDAGAAKAGMASKKATIVKDEPLAFTTSTGSYQKGFTNKELKEYIEKTLGDSYTVDIVPNKANISGSAVVVTKEASKLKKFDGGLIAKALGISDEDLEWAKSQDQRFDPKGKLDGEGDAARHLALGWITQRADNPERALQAANFRENLSITRKDKPMDQHNNNLGATIQANTYKEAEAEIDRLIKEKKAMFMSSKESSDLRPYGYAKGGEVTTRVGRPTHQGDFGKGQETYSERSVTFPLNKNKTKWITFPSVLDSKGTVSSEDDVREYVRKNGPIDPLTGEEFPIHDTQKQAIDYAIERSAGLMKKSEGGKVYNTLKRNCS